MRLRFKGLKGYRDVKVNVNTIHEAYKLIDNDLKENYPHFTSYYKRTWMEDGRLKFDVGDYSCFYYLELEEGETWEEKVQESLLR